MSTSEFEIVSADDNGICVRDVKSGHEFGFKVRRFEDGWRALASQADFVPSSFTNLDPFLIGQKARSFAERELLRSGLIDRLAAEGSAERGDFGCGHGCIVTFIIG